MNKEDTIKITMTDEEGDDVVHFLPAAYEVCGTCRGKGSHVNRNIDGNGITGSEWAELDDSDPEFRENYFSGVYDVACEECDGLRVIQVIDEDRCSPEQKKVMEDYYRDQAESARWDAEDRATRRAESGGGDW